MWRFTNLQCIFYGTTDHYRKSVQKNGLPLRVNCDDSSQFTVNVCIVKVTDLTTGRSKISNAPAEVLRGTDMPLGHRRAAPRSAASQLSTGPGVRNTGASNEITHCLMNSVLNQMPEDKPSTTASPSQVAASAKDVFNGRDRRQRPRTCEHGKFKPYCKECKGSMLCAHLRHKNRCASCKRSSEGMSASGGISFVFQ